MSPTGVSPAEQLPAPHTSVLLYTEVNRPVVDLEVVFPLVPVEGSPTNIASHTVFNLGVAWKSTVLTGGKQETRLKIGVRTRLLNNRDSEIDGRR